MKRLMTICLCVLFFAGTTLAHWNLGNPAKWVQLPDLTPTGIDVWNTGWEHPIADDFECTSTDPIIDVHLWGSWLNDEHEAFLSRIWLSIYDDDPVGTEGPDPENQFSKPGLFRWEGEFTPSGVGVDGSYTERAYYRLTTGAEMFWNPNTGAMGADTIVWQYNISIDPAKAFVQEGSDTEPRIYWLVVNAFPEWDNEEYGWKTRDIQDGHFMDDAVYWDADTQNWAPLVYPDGHPYEGQSIDMAFVITPEPATICLLGLGTLSLIRRKR
jgi:hypothetical protein